MQLELTRLQCLLLTYQLQDACTQSKIRFRCPIALQNPSDATLLVTKLSPESRVPRKVGINDSPGAARGVSQVGLEERRECLRVCVNSNKM